MKKIVFTGGGTAGHIMPNIAIINDLQGYEIYYLGTNGMEKDIISQYPNIKFIEIPAVKFVRAFTFKNLLIPFKLISSINICKEKLKQIDPQIIFSKGGFVSIPVCFAGAKLNIPVLTHESDLTIGLANKLISNKVKYLCCSFRETANKYKKNSIFTGSPIRKKIFSGKKDIILNRHNITTNKPIILIVGGSLGAQSINEIIWNNITVLTKKFTIIHIVGKKNYNYQLHNTSNYIQINFANDIENYFDASDIIISRAGSNTIFELLALCKPMILIPLPKKSSRGDQILNAQNFHNNNYANIIKQEDLTIEILLDTINDTLKNKEILISNMKKAEAKLGNKNIIDLIKKNSK